MSLAHLPGRFIRKSSFMQSWAKKDCRNKGFF